MIRTLSRQQALLLVWAGLAIPLIGAETLYWLASPADALRAAWIGSTGLKSELPVSTRSLCLIMLGPTTLCTLCGTYLLLRIASVGAAIAQRLALLSTKLFAAAAIAKFTANTLIAVALTAQDGVGRRHLDVSLGGAELLMIAICLVAYLLKVNIEDARTATDELSAFV